MSKAAFFKFFKNWIEPLSITINKLPYQQTIKYYTAMEINEHSFMCDNMLKIIILIVNEK